MESVKFQYGAHEVVLQTGGIARQADAAVLVSMGDTVVLVTAVGKKEADPSRGFFPLTVNYQEKVYAAGRIPGGYFKREGRPTEKETLTSRLIDRPIRPLFPEGFINEVQVVALPKQMGNMPVANGSRLPVCPAFLALNKRLTRCKAWLDERPSGLSNKNNALRSRPLLDFAMGAKLRFFVRDY